ncbi:methyltransferase regulatory domain-containing protein [Bradyrhizobium diazoefficiens]|nr:class I SAM-dependent methyltransferase [Bradyrhizobium diazoefficiens]MBR0704808.1 methyltransferase regulatory domain-containing protein [Bradyrhizobium diazoefficiens]MBR0773157.1 methyltransferase regulatory domain-containing protein [Bradyrhizobium diazoefficiens]
MSEDWKSGYVADVAYTLGFYRELAPTFLNFACLLNNVEGPPLDRPLHYCELGCGRGYGTTLLAAANPDSQFTGIDFNPSHIAEARNLALRAGLTNITFHETSFAEAVLLQTGENPGFDVVVAHGVYTWVERAIRKDIVEFVRTKLRSGGLFFVSYNCMPGWATVDPVQRLMIETEKRSSRSSIDIVNESLDLIKMLVDSSCAFVTQNPGLAPRIEKLMRHDRNYLAHEFLNSGWEPLYVTETIADLAAAKLTFVGSASLIENRIDMCAPKSLQPAIMKAPDVSMRELLKDYAVNKQFRRDIYIKGPQRLTPRVQSDRLKAMAFARAQTKYEPIEKFILPVGELSLNPKSFDALTFVLAEKPATGAQILASASNAGVSEEEALIVLLLLINSNVIAPARPDYGSVDRSASVRLNSIVMEMTLSSDTHRFLASPLLGSAIPASFLDRVAASALRRMSDNPSGEDLASLAFKLLAENGQKFQRNGKNIEPTPENIKEVAPLLNNFLLQQYPVWKMWGLL